MKQYELEYNKIIRYRNRKDMWQNDHHIKWLSLLMSFVLYCILS